MNDNEFIQPIEASTYLPHFFLFCLNVQFVSSQLLFRWLFVDYVFSNVLNTSPLRFESAHFVTLTFVVLGILGRI